MNLIQRILIASLCFTSTLFAAEFPILRVGTESFNPPFVMQGAHNAVFGFDIDLMNALCKKIQRTCQYRIMRFDQLIEAVEKKEIDVAISSITITPDRAKFVNFSLPYLLSYSRFLIKPKAKAIPFTLAMLNDKKIGLETGTIFPQQLETMGVKNPKLKFYTTVPEQLSALNKGEVDIILLDNPTAMYWSANSSESFQLAGPAYMYGFGLGIAINAGEGALSSALNQALLQYQNSPDFKQNYNRYLLEF